MDPVPPEAAAAVPTSPPPLSEVTSTPPSGETTSLKPIHSLVLDTGPLIKNEIAISTLLAQAEVLYTIPAVISEIRDEATRSRLQTSLIPFLTLRSPRPASVKFVSDFARKTGDLQVLSRPDLHLIALTYELECERNHGDWRLRKEPGQKTVNGKPPAREGGDSAVEAVKSDDLEPATAVQGEDKETLAAATDEQGTTDATSGRPEHNAEVEEVESQVQNLTLESAEADDAALPPSDNNTGSSTTADENPPDDVVEDDSDSDGWITPSNIKKHQARDGLALKTPSSSSPGPS